MSKVPTIRCAIYTRKSVAEGLEQEFNSLDAQRASAEAYIASQAHEGWICLPERYDDGGVTGANMDRPALAQLMADIAAGGASGGGSESGGPGGSGGGGGIDCVVVYKVDRLSRSLLDFARIMETFEKHGVSFVSVTQQFNTTHSMGRLTLNILFSFAQFEREIISERTRDKFAAARRAGRWSGGIPPLGYDVDRSNGSIRLVVNSTEANHVCQAFELYLQQRSLLKAAQILDERGWRTKQWTTRKGHERGGRRFDKSTLLYLLRNITYCGKLRHRGHVYKGLHEAIICEQLYEQVQAMLNRNGRAGGSNTRSEALLNGLLFCAHCGCAMSHSYTSKGTRRYRYYVCGQASRRGWNTCPSKSLPAAAIERFVFEQLTCVPEEFDEPNRAALAKLVECLDPRSSHEQRDLLRKFVRRVDYDGGEGKLRIAIAPNGHDEDSLAPAPAEALVIERELTFERGRLGVKEARCGDLRASDTPPPPEGHDPGPGIPGVPGVPRISRLMALAIHFDQQIRAGALRDYAEIARFGHVTRARISQIMSLLDLAPDIQEALLFVTPTTRGRDAIREAAIRPIAREPNWARQRKMWRRVLIRSAGSRPESSPTRPADSSLKPN